MGDADDSYDFADLEPFVERLREGYDLVTGNRFKGGIQPGAMPWLHRKLGNPVLSFVGRRLYGTPCGDIYCGLRGFDREKIRALDVQSPGMEFAIEMIVKATMARLARHRGADDALAGRRGPRAAPEHLEGRLEVDPPVAALQPEVAVPLSGAGVLLSWGSPGWPGSCPETGRSAASAST